MSNTLLNADEIFHRVEVRSGLGGLVDDGVRRRFARLVDAFNEYGAARFAEAKAQFENLVEEFADGPSRLLAARCARFIASPTADWKGIWKMESK